MHHQGRFFQMYGRLIARTLLLTLLMTSAPAWAKEERREAVRLWALHGHGEIYGWLESPEAVLDGLNAWEEEQYSECMAASNCGTCGKEIFHKPWSFGGPLINGQRRDYFPTSKTVTWFQKACPEWGTPADGPYTEEQESVDFNGAGAALFCPEEAPLGTFNFPFENINGVNVPAYDAYCVKVAPDPPQQCPRVPGGNTQYGGPIDALTQSKIRCELDYSSPDGMLQVDRSYASSLGRWSWAHNASLADFTGRTTAGPPASSNLIASITAVLGGPYIDVPPPPPSTVARSFPLVRSGTVGALVTLGNGRRAEFVEATSGNFSTLAPDKPALSLITVSGQHQWLLRLPEGGLQVFNATGQLIRHAFADGRSLTYQKQANSLTVTANPGGRQLVYSRSTPSLLPDTYDVVTLPDGNQLSYAMNSLGSVSEVTYADNSSKTYLYDEPAHSETSPPSIALNRLTGLIDESGVRLGTYKYNIYGAISTELAGGANKYSFELGANFTKVIRPPLGGESYVWWNTGPDGEHQLASRSRPAGAGSAGGWSSYAYDASGNVSSHIDYQGNATCYTNDQARGVELFRIEGMSAWCPPDIETYVIPPNTPQRKITTQWHPAWNFPVARAEPRRITRWIYNGQPDPTAGGVVANCAPAAPLLPNGEVVAVVCKQIEQATTDLTGEEGLSASTAGAARVWTFSYNGFGQVLTQNGPRTDVSDITTLTYYSCSSGHQCGQIHTVSNALGHVTTFNTYNAHGQPLSITDANGVTTILTYDLRQRMTSRTVGGEQTLFAYWPTGLLKKVTLPDNSYLEYSYDNAHRLTQINDAVGNRIEYTLDAAGNRAAEERFDPSNALRLTQTRVFDALSRTAATIGAAGTAAVTTEYAYDNNGNQTNVNAPLGRASSQTYDSLDRLSQVTDPLFGVVQYGYDGSDQLTSVSDPAGHITSYGYTGLGDLVEQESPDSGTTLYTHDAAGNAQTITDARNKTATLTHDALNRVTAITYADQSISYTYDTGAAQKGQLTQVADNSGSTSWTYDAQGRVLSRQQAMGAISKSVGYFYDLQGRLETLTLPSGNTVTYGYSNGRVTSLTLNGSIAVLSNALYLPFGGIEGWAWGNSTLAVHEHDADGNTSVIDSAGLKSYAYDDAFRITDIVDTGNSALSQSYDYDLLDRLTGATGTGLNQSWTYDANGNRLTQGGSSASTYNVSSSSNRLDSVSGALTRSYAYDNAGNITADGAATFVYNDAGRMVSATKAGAITTYAVNALGQRVKKTTSGSSRYFVYDEAGHLLGEYNNVGTLIQETIWLDDTPVATIRPNGGGVSLFYVHADHLDTPRRISRPSDNVVVWRWDADPFGTTAANEDPDGDSVAFAYGLRFPGQYYDAESGLSYNYYRDYDPDTGRYVQSDPIGLEGGINPYGYVGGNPIMYGDRMGLAEWWDQIVGVGPVDAATARNDSNTALEGARQSGLPGLHNGPADAYRHCLWSCLMTQHLGEEQARTVGDTHEENGRRGRQPRDEEQMDERNNEVGRQCGREQNERSCAERCMFRFRRGGLHGLGGNRMPPPRRHVPGH